MIRGLNIILFSGLLVSLSCSALVYTNYGVEVELGAQGVKLLGVTPKDDLDINVCYPLGKCRLMLDADYQKLMRDFDDYKTQAEACK